MGSRPEIGRWWFLFKVCRDWARGYPGWRRFDLALIKLKSRPPDGEIITKEHYRGFWLRFYFWLPWESAL